MMGQVDAENQIAMANAMPDQGQGAPSGGGSSAASKPEPKSKPKSESKSSKGDLTLEDGTFTRLKRIL